MINRMTNREKKIWRLADALECKLEEMKRASLEKENFGEAAIMSVHEAMATAIQHLAEGRES